MSDATDWELRDAAGKPLLSVTNSGTLSAPSAFVRAVTERAGALEALLRSLMTDPDESAQRVLDMDLGTDFTNAARRLLAEIDAAKGGG